MTLIGGTAKGAVNEFELRALDATCAVLTCRGGLTWDDRGMLANTVDQFMAGHASVERLIIDLSDVDFVSSAGVGGLFQVAQCIRARGATPAAAVTPEIKRLLNTVGIDRILTLYPNLNAALTGAGRV